VARERITALVVRICFMLFGGYIKPVFPKHAEASMGTELASQPEGPWISALQASARALVPTISTRWGPP
jgi:hypothetical protein